MGILGNRRILRKSKRNKLRLLIKMQKEAEILSRPCMWRCTLKNGEVIVTTSDTQMMYHFNGGAVCEWTRD